MATAKQELQKVIEDFRTWQCMEYPNLDAAAIGWEWETNYDNWSSIGTAFLRVLAEEDTHTVDENLLQDMINIIARDNESEWLIDELVQYPNWFAVLCRFSLQTSEPEAKWQFASRLPLCQCSPAVKDLIMIFVQDEHEYVCRRALMALPAIRPDQVAVYVQLFWDRNKYSAEEQMYQRIAALYALQQIQSSLLPHYLQAAKADGSFYLVQYAQQIEAGQNC